MKTQESQCEVIVLSKLGEYQEDWAKVYIEPNNAYSDCGGRITVNIGDDHIGSHFFSHCGTKTFKQFIAKCDYDYLIKKIFGTKDSIDVESGDELIQSILSEDWLRRVKEARHSGGIDKSDLRDLYDQIKELEFRDIGELSYMLGSDEYDTMSKIFGDEWFYDNCFKKENPIYARQQSIVESIVQHFRSQDEVAA